MDGAEPPPVRVVEAVPPPGRIGQGGCCEGGRAGVRRRRRFAPAAGAGPGGRAGARARAVGDEWVGSETDAPVQRPQRCRDEARIVVCVSHALRAGDGSGTHGAASVGVVGCGAVTAYGCSVSNATTTRIVSGIVAVADDAGGGRAGLWIPPIPVFCCTGRIVAGDAWTRHDDGGYVSSRAGTSCGVK